MRIRCWLRGFPVEESPKCATTASKALSHGLPKLATGLPHTILARAHEDSRHRKIRASQSAFCRERSWRLLTRLSAYRLDCGRGTTARFDIKRRSFGKSIKAG